MVYHNSWDKDKKCQIQGQTAEDLFFNILSAKGEVRKSTVKQNKRHVDFFLIKDGKEISFDVKARKRVNRDDDVLTDELIWVEILGVTGNVGWAFSNNVNFIAFEREKDFLVVGQPELQTLIEKICDLNKLVSSASQALYKGYKRFGRNDLISLIKASDITNIKHEVWLKT